MKFVKPPTVSRYRRCVKSNLDSNKEDQYEVVQIVAKTPRADGQGWFDWLFDITTENCEPTEDGYCSCRMEHMSGSGGTLQQCYDWTTTVGRKLQPIHLARALVYMAEKLEYENIAISEDVQDIVEWAVDEIKFEEKWENWTSDESEEEE